MTRAGRVARQLGIRTLACPDPHNAYGPDEWPAIVPSNPDVTPRLRRIVRIARMAKLDVRAEVDHQNPTHWYWLVCPIEQFARWRRLAQLIERIGPSRTLALVRAGRSRESR